jgi:type VI secretion system protein ImpK
VSEQNPFSEPDDTDRTIIRPSPGGRRPALAAAPAAPVEDVGEIVQAGLDPLLAAAGPLLQLLAKLRNTLHPPDAGDLRGRAAREVRQFEQRCRAANIPAELLSPAHYALCASLDDAVLNTPWGATGVWQTRPLSAGFHNETNLGEGFFRRLDQVRQTPDAALSVLELMYLCLALGFQGPYRSSPDGPGALEQLRADVYALIQLHRPATAAALSARWQGISAPYRPARAVVPVWVVASAALAAVALVFAWALIGLNDQSDALFAQMLAAPPDHMPTIARTGLVQPLPPPPQAEPDILDRLRAVLKPQIDQHLVEVLGTAATPIVRIRNHFIFGAGSATVQPGSTALLERIGTALKDEPGSVSVIGYTDNEPIHTVRFPSNFQLSASRAQAVKAMLARTIGEAGRLSAEGRADAEPLEPNTTAAGRETNRRIEVVLHRPQ